MHAYCALQTLQTVAFLASYALLHPDERFLVAVPKASGSGLACTVRVGAVLLGGPAATRVVQPRGQHHWRSMLLPQQLMGRLV